MYYFVFLNEVAELKVVRVSEAAQYISVLTRSQFYIGWPSRARQEICAVPLVWYNGIHFGYRSGFRLSGF